MAEEEEVDAQEECPECENPVEVEATSCPNCEGGP